MSILNEFPEKDKWCTCPADTTGRSYYKHQYVRWLETQIQELEKQNETLKKVLSASRKSLEAIRQREVRRYKHEQDYLPYEERYE